MIKRIPFLFVSILLALAPFCRSDDAAAILKQVEERLIGSLAPNDMVADMTMTLRDGSGQKVRQLRAWTKNNTNQEDWRVMKFLTPAEIRDLGFLVLSGSEMYLYMPELHRVRRIASSSKKDSFANSDFSYEDMGTSGFSGSYDAKLAAEDGETWTLELTRKPGADKPYSRMTMTVAKGIYTPRHMEMFDQAGKLLKVSDQAHQQVGRYWVMASVTMIDKKKGTSTQLEFKNVKTDQKLGDDIFSERFLKRPAV